MSVIIEHTTVNVAITIERDGAAKGRVISEGKSPKDGEHVLPLHYSLMGEVEAVLVSLSIEYSFNDRTSYRYDWVVGVSEPLTWWDWHGAMRHRKERAISAHLLIDCGESGFSFSEMSPMLLGLQPSLHSVPWVDKHAGAIRESLIGVAELVREFPSCPDSSRSDPILSAQGKRMIRTGGFTVFSTRKRTVVLWNGTLTTK